MDTLITCLWAYIIGSIPFGYILAKFYKIDIHKVGSGSIGSTNIYRALGLKAAILVFFLDMLKGLIPTFIAAHILFQDQLSIGLVGLATIIGHIFSVFLKFKGGKGVATSLGVLIILGGWQFALALTIVWVIAFYLVKVMSLVNLILSLTIIPYFLIFEKSSTYMLIGIGMISLVWYSHRTNISRLLQGKEQKLQRKKRS